MIAAILARGDPRTAWAVVQTANGEYSPAGLPNLSPDQLGLDFTRGTLLSTADGGATWTEEDLPVPSALPVHPYSYALPGDVEESRAGLVAIGQFSPVGAAGVPQAPGLVYAVVKAAGSWQEPRIVGTVANVTAYARLGLLANGHLLAVWNADSGMAWSVSADDGTTWSPEAPFAPDCGMPSDVRPTPGGALVLCWTGDPLSATPAQAWAFDAEAATWAMAAAPPFPNDEAQPSLSACREFALASEGATVVAVGSRCDGVMMSVSSDAGATWSNATLLSDILSIDEGYEGAQYARGPCLQDGVLHVMGYGADAGAKPVAEGLLEGFRTMNFVAQLTVPSMGLVAEGVWTSPPAGEGLAAPPSYYALLAACHPDAVLMLNQGLDQAWASPAKA